VKRRLAWTAWLKPSARVDLRQVLAGVRPALRTEVEGRVTPAELGRWSRRAGLFALADRDGFLVLSRRPGYARRLMAIDRAPGDHTAQLGHWLGYPNCCARAAARQGEAHLDTWAARLSHRRYMGRFAAIDVAAYRQGRATLSHIPCSASCNASLRMATALERTDGGLACRRRWHIAPSSGHSCGLL
jgi:hypothetical protein